MKYIIKITFEFSKEHHHYLTGFSTVVGTPHLTLFKAEAFVFAVRVYAEDAAANLKNLVGECVVELVEI